MKLEYKITNQTKYKTIKQLLKEEFHISERLLKRLKKENQIFMNNFPVSINTSFNLNDVISVCLDFDEESENIVPTKMKLNILFEDDSLLIVNKSAGIPVHPSMDHYTDSLSNGIMYYFNSIGLKRKIRIVNRLDKNTSGIVIFAKNEYIQECLIGQMKNNTFQKEYLAVLEGLLDKKFGTINAQIARKENSIIERQVSPDGKESITHYKVLKEYSNYSLVHFILETGRTHQIRVHSKYIAHPILGDTLYGKFSHLIERQALHSCKVIFIHPITNKKMEIIAELPNDIKKLI